MFSNHSFLYSSRALAVLLLTGTLGACTSFGEELKPDLSAVIDPSLRKAAQAAEANYDYKTAASHYRSLVQRNPDDGALVLKLMRVLRYGGLPQQAIDLGERQLARTGGDPVVLTELGKAYLAQDRVNVAVRYLSQANDQAPDNWETWSALGVAYDYQRRFEEAVLAHRRALALSPDNPQVLNNLGLSRAQAGDLDEAIQLLRRAADQPKATAQVRQNLALVTAIKGDLGGAERLARQDLPNEMVRNNLSYYRMLAAAARLN